MTEQKGLPPCTPEGQPNLPDVARISGPQEYHTPKRQRTMDNAVTEDTTGKMNPNPNANPNAQLTPFTDLLKDGMPRKSIAVVNDSSFRYYSRLSALLSALLCLAILQPSYPL